MHSEEVTAQEKQDLKILAGEQMSKTIRVAYNALFEVFFLTLTKQSHKFSYSSSRTPRIKVIDDHHLFFASHQYNK